MSKKAIGPEALVIMISLLATAVIFLVILYPQWRGATEGSADSPAECSSELLFRSMVKTVSFGYGDVPVNCEVKKRTITQKDINKFQGLSKQATQNYVQTNSQLKTTYPNNELGQTNWALSKIIADELVSCYGKGWQGKINLDQAGLLDFFPQDGSLCLYCSQITYDEQLTNSKINLELTAWLETNIAGDQTYYDKISSSLFSISEQEIIKSQGVASFLSILLKQPVVNTQILKSIATRVFISQPYIDTSKPTAIMLVIMKDGGMFPTAYPLEDLKKGTPSTGPICRKVIGEL